MLNQLQPVAIGGSVCNEGPAIPYRPAQLAGIPIAYARGFSSAVDRQCHVPIRPWSATADISSGLRRLAMDTTRALMGNTGGEFAQVVRQLPLRAPGVS